MINEYEFINLDKEIKYSIFRFVSKGTERVIPIHYHDEVELLYCEKGSLTIWIEGEKKIINNGELFFLNKNVPHATQGGKGCSVIVLYQSSDIFDKEALNISMNNNCSSKSFNEIINLIIQIYENSLSKESFIQYKIHSNILKLNFLLFKEYSCTIDELGQKQIIKNNKFNRILSIVNSNYDKDLNLEKLSQLSNYSMHYISRLFKLHTNSTFLSYKNSLSLEKALKLIETTDNDFTFIALQSGFPNEKSMRKQFKTILNKTPRDYKRQKKTEI